MTTKQFASAFALALTSIAPTLSAEFNSSRQWTFHHSGANGSKAFGAEIVSFDSVNNRLWVVGTDANQADLGFGGVDVLDLSGGLVQSFDTSLLGGVNSVAVKNGQAAVSISAPLKTDPGLVQFFDAASFSLLASVPVGANPDAVTYTPDGARLLVANEGEPSSYLAGPSADPEGSISIINTATFQSQTAGFHAFNGQADALKAANVRLTGPNATVAQDLEPEFIAVSADGSRAIATLQEANSVALIDVASAAVLSITPMGLKDHSLPGQGLDASDRDGTGNQPKNGNIQNWNVKGLYMPDGIASLNQGGNQFYITANEGDSRADWPGGNDEIRAGNASIDPDLNRVLTGAHGADWQSNNDKLNRLNISTSGDLDGDGDQDELHVFGGRSFSILDASGNLIFDSGDQLEQIISQSYPGLWDDGRSDNKGPEPESAVTGSINGLDLLFLGLERSNAIMVWDLTNLGNIEFLDMIFTPGDVGPEGLSFFSNDDGHFLAVANEVSQTTSLYRVAVPAMDPGTFWLLGSTLLGMGALARRKR